MPRSPLPSASPQSRLKIETFGRIGLFLNGREIHLPNRKSRALVGYLALSNRNEETRERLVGLLWSEVEESKARASLRQTLHEIRGAFHALGWDGLLTDKLTAALNPTALDVDLKAVLEDAKAGHAHRMLFERERLFEELMPGSEDLDPAFGSWLLSKRQTLQGRLMRDLEVAMRAPSTAKIDREKLARALIALDSTHEEAARLLIEMRAADGDVGAALGIYKKLWDVLDDEFDIEPSVDTQLLIAKVKLAQPISDSSPRLPTRSDALDPDLSPIPDSRSSTQAKLLISIGNFDATGLEPESGYLVHGFRRELIANLVRFREWLIRDLPVQPNAQHHYADDELILDAGGHQTDGGVRLVLTLREPASGTYLWSEKIDISPSRLWTAQQSVIQRIASALNVHISANRMAAMSRRPESDLLAYDLWLRGQTTMRSFEAGDWHKAADIFRELIAKLPGFAPAYSSLAQLHNSIHVAHHGVFREPLRKNEALGCAREAVRLDPADSRGQLALAWANLMAEQFDQAGVNYELAVELNDNDPWTLVSCGLGLAFGGEHARARELADRALALSPSPSGAHWGYQARIQFLGGNYARAAEAAELSADVPAGPAWRTAILSHLGSRTEAAQELEHFFEVSRARWYGSIPWSRETAIRWFLHAFPIKYLDDWERLRQGLAMAGAQTEAVQYGIFDSTAAPHWHIPMA